MHLFGEEPGGIIAPTLPWRVNFEEKVNDTTVLGGFVDLSEAAMK